MMVLISVGPLLYPSQPSVSALAIVAIGVSTFLAGHWFGTRWFAAWLNRRSVAPVQLNRALSTAVAVSAILGLAGIALIAIDRTLLSGVENSGYSALLRCAPELVEAIEIKRTPLIYIGYLTFSFALASLALFLLKGEEVKGWRAYLAQLAILSPIGYALLYSGRIPILLAIALIGGTMLARLAQGRQALPGGHHLVTKAIVLVVLFMVYTNAMWSIRRDFCSQMHGLISKLQDDIKAPDSAELAELKAKEAELVAQISSARVASGGDASQRSTVEYMRLESQLKSTRSALASGGGLRSAGMIDAASLSRNINEARSVEQTKKPPGVESELSGLLEEAWHVRPRDYVTAAVDSGRISMGTALGLLSNYFYLTHGIHVMDTAWHARAELSPLWGTYEIGVLSPILRVFFPNNEVLASMNAQMQTAGIYGFFPSSWGAAYIDFGGPGAIIYILIWGLMAGIGYYGTRHTAFATPPLLLAFSLASIFLSPIQGPLGVANSALVLVSMLFVGLAVDLRGFRITAREPSR
jgi:hypothetical protein